MSQVVRIEGFSALAAGAALLHDPVRALHSLHAQYGPLIDIRPPRLKAGPGRATVLIADLRVARTMLQQPALFENVALYPVRGPADSAQRRLRGGMIRMHGQAHRDLRRLITPVLERSVVAELEPRMRKIAAREVATWPQGETADLVVLVRRLAQRLALELLFGESDPARGNMIAEALDRHLRMTRGLEALIFPLDLPWTAYGRLLRQAARTEAVLEAWVSERRQGPPGEDLMSILCQAQGQNGEALSATQAATQLWTLYGASFETTATTLVWTLLLLAQHPAVAGRLLAELGGSVDPASPTPIQAAPPPLMTHVIKEAMRLCTPVPLQLRRVASQTVVPGTEAPLAKGDRMVISACVINRQADAFPDPLVFDPARWACADAPDAALLAFSAGPRACMGYWFALSAMGAAIGAVWTRLRLAPVDGARIDYRTLITMAAGRTPVTLTAQDGAFAAARIGGVAPRMAPALAPTASTREAPFPRRTGAPI